MNTCILNDMSQVAYISYERHVKYGLNIRYIHAYLHRICVLKGKIKWIRDKYIKLEIALNTPLKCKIMILKIGKNKKILEKILESLFGIMNRVIDIYFCIRLHFFE